MTIGKVLRGERYRLQTGTVVSMCNILELTTCLHICGQLHIVWLDNVAQCYYKPRCEYHFLFSKQTGPAS